MSGPLEFRGEEVFLGRERGWDPEAIVGRIPPCLVRRRGFMGRPRIACPVGIPAGHEGPGRASVLPGQFRFGGAGRSSRREFAALKGEGIRYLVNGLRPFRTERLCAPRLQLQKGLFLNVLRVERILASKQAAGRPKDLAVIPMLRQVIRSRRLGGMKERSGTSVRSPSR